MDKKIIQKIGIIGDGLTGNLVALALFRLGYPVELVEKRGLKSKPSVASISISNDSFNFLKKLKLKNLEKMKHKYFLENPENRLLLIELQMQIMNYMKI